MTRTQAFLKQIKNTDFTDNVKAISEKCNCYKLSNNDTDVIITINGIARTITKYDEPEITRIRPEIDSITVDDDSKVFTIDLYYQY